MKSLLIGRIRKAKGFAKGKNYTSATPSFHSFLLRKLKKVLYLNNKMKTKYTLFGILPVIDELSNIKVSELEIGYKMKKILVPELNEIQNEITKLFNIKIDDIMRA